MNNSVIVENYQTFYRVQSVKNLEVMDSVYLISAQEAHDRAQELSKITGYPVIMNILPKPQA